MITKAIYFNGKDYNVIWLDAIWLRSNATRGCGYVQYYVGTKEACENRLRYPPLKGRAQHSSLDGWLMFAAFTDGNGIEHIERITDHMIQVSSGKPGQKDLILYPSNKIWKKRF